MTKGDGPMIAVFLGIGFVGLAMLMLIIAGGILSNIRE
jgi:hypothetical protein